MTEKKEEPKAEKVEKVEKVAKTDTPGEPKEKPPPRKKILIIDDEEPVRRMLSLVLEKCGYQVATADNGRTGVVRAFTERPDLILVDLMMPGLDGKQTISGIKADPETEKVPIIVLTAESTKENILEAKALGARSIVAKVDFKLESFLERIKEALEPSRKDEKTPAWLEETSQKLGLGKVEMKAPNPHPKPAAKAPEPKKTKEAPKPKH